MRVKTRTIGLTAAIFLLLSLYIPPPLYGADPYTDKLELTATVKDFSDAVLDQDADALMEMTHLPGTFQFDKEEKIEKFLKSYYDVIVETRIIEVKSITRISETEGEAEISVYQFDRRPDIPGMDLPAREEVWKFIKLKKGSKLSPWLFVLE